MISSPTACALQWTPAAVWNRAPKIRGSPERQDLDLEDEAVTPTPTPLSQDPWQVVFSEPGFLFSLVKYK